jgi:hypothetical protein
MRVAILLIAALPAFAQLQLSGLDGLAAKATESAVITLDAATLKLANGFLGNAKDKDGKASKLLAKLKSITVRAYEFARAGQYDAAILQPIREQLRGPGWSKIMDLKESNELFELYSKTEQGESAGFVILAAESNELAVIAIEGTIDLADLASLGGQFGIPDLPLQNQPQPNQKDKKGKE